MRSVLLAALAVAAEAGDSATVATLAGELRALRAEAPAGRTINLDAERARRGR